MSLGSDGATMTMPVVPAGTAYNTGNNGFGGFGDNSAWWIIILFLFVFCGWGNGNWGGSNGGGNSIPYVVANQGYDTRSDIQRGFDNQAVITKLDGITQGICDSAYALNNTMTTGFSNAELSRCNQQAALMQQLFAMQMQAQNCCCETREAIQGVNYNLATQSCDTRNTIQNTTRDIIDNQNGNARAILDALTAQRIEAKDQRIAEQAQTIAQLQLAASQSNQNAVLMAAMDANKAEILRRTGSDCPVAAYVVPNPNCCYGNPVGVSYGYNQGGCNNGCSGCGC